jgi:hypothetical protein
VERDEGREEEKRREEKRGGRREVGAEGEGNNQEVAWCG